MRCLLVGNFGVGNLGDEALKEYFLKTFSDVEWTVLSAHPQSIQEVPRLPFGIRSLFSSWWRTIHAYRSTNAVVFGGGSLLTDVESVTACRLWWWHAKVAHFFGKPVLLTFQGIGPFRTTRGERWARATISMASFLSVRDEASARRIQEWDLNRKIVQSFDPVFSLLSAYKSHNSTKNVLAIFPRDSYDKNLVLKLQQVFQSRKPEDIIFVLMRPRFEKPIVERIQAETGLQGSIYEVTSLVQLREILQSVDHVISQRYHGAIAALATGKEVMIIPQMRGDKLDELQGMLQRGVQTEDLLRQVEAGESALREALNAIASRKEGT